MSPTAARKVVAQITLTPATVISRLASGEPRASVAIKRSTASIPESRNSIWRSAESTLALLLGQLQLEEPTPALDPEQVAERGAAD